MGGYLANNATIVIYFEFKFITEVSEKLEHETHDPNAQLTGTGTVRVNIHQIQMNIPKRLTNQMSQISELGTGRVHTDCTTIYL